MDETNTIEVNRMNKEAQYYVIKDIVINNQSVQGYWVGDCWQEFDVYIALKMDINHAASIVNNHKGATLQKV